MSKVNGKAFFLDIVGNSKVNNYEVLNVLEYSFSRCYAGG